MSNEVTTDTITLKELVEEYEDLSEDEQEYEFSNGRTFLRPVTGDRGVYVSGN